MSKAPQDARELAGASAPGEVPGVWPFEEIDRRLELVPIAARRALDRAGVHLSLEGWRALDLADRIGLVEHGRARDVDAAGVLRITARAGAAAREIDVAPELDEIPGSLACLPVVARAWGDLSPLERSALGHAERSARKRGDPSRLDRAVEEILRSRR